MSNALLSTHNVLFCLQLETQRLTLAGITRHPTEQWMEQMARNLTDDDSGGLCHYRYVVHDRDTKFCASFRSTLLSASVQPLKLPPRSPNLNAFAERWVLSVKQECLSKMVLFGEGSLKRALSEFIEHYHLERNHQGKGNVLLCPARTNQPRSADDRVHCKRRLGGLLRYYSRVA